MSEMIFRLHRSTSSLSLGIATQAANTSDVVLHPDQPSAYWRWSDGAVGFWILGPRPEREFPRSEIGLELGDNGRSTEGVLAMSGYGGTWLDTC